MLKYIDRNKENSIVLIPGWASDYRIFGSLDLEFNYLVPIKFSPSDFEAGLIDALKENDIKKVSLLGWSLGGFLAQEFVLKYPNLVNELILISIRKKYKEREVSEVRRNLEKNKKAYLYKFYTQSFCKKSDMKDFKGLFKKYIEELDLEYLLSTLDYLAKSETKPESLREIKKIKIIHGEYDRIAPIKEAIDIKNNLINANLITVKGAGHMPFLKRDFNIIFNADFHKSNAD